jgi:pentatricopeptide repeat protein
MYGVQVSYNTLLSVCAAAEDAEALWEQAEQVLAEMRGAKVAPDTLSYGTAMRSMALAGRLQVG